MVLSPFFPLLAPVGDEKYNATTQYPGYVKLGYCRLKSRQEAHHLAWLWLPNLPMQ